MSSNKTTSHKKKKKKQKKTSPFKFWDSASQKGKARYYMKKHGLDTSNQEVRESVRSMLRVQEATKKEKDANPSHLSQELSRFEKTKDINSLNISSRKQFVRDILTQGIEQALRSGPLPPPTGYNSEDGTWWDNPVDFENRKRVKFYINDQGKRQKLPCFGKDDIAWIEFFLGDPVTGGTLLRPKKKKDFKELKKKNLLGKVFSIQQEMSDYLDDNPWAKFEVWRGAGKTVIVIGKLLRKICDNPNECLFFQSETDDKTIQRIRTIKRELQTNQKIIAFYGYLPADSSATGGKKKQLGKDYKGKWSEGVIELKREYSGIEPTVMGISWNTGRGVGYHFTGGVLDDPWSGHNQNREGDYKKFWNWWGEFYGSLEYAEFCWVLCTKKGQDDIYTKMDDDKMFSPFRRKLVIEMPESFELVEKNGAYVDVKILNRKPFKKFVYDDCFGKYTIEKALLIRQRIGPVMFEREYQNNPRRAQGKLFNWDHIKYCKPDSADFYARVPFNLKLKNKMRGLIFYDPAFGLTQSASYNALVAMAEYDKRIYILDIWIGHWTKEDRVYAFNEAHRQHPNFPFYCEHVMHQLNIIKDLTSSTGIFLRPYDPKGKGSGYRHLFEGQKYAAKKAKIYDGLEGIVADQRLYLMKGMRYFNEFEDEFKNFPDGIKMDVIDASSMGALILDKRGGSTEVLDSSFVQRDAFLPNNMTIGNTFKIGKY